MEHTNRPPCQAREDPPPDNTKKTTIPLFPVNILQKKPKKPNPPIQQDKMPNGPGAASISTIESIIKPAEATGGSGKSKCIECDGYECCCIPIPCVVM
ncbi:hypothetical protein LA080_009928 [Diaporthe eres]|nr:hypothetical protein LA080_009928 [Diaporthe eres]